MTDSDDAVLLEEIANYLHVQTTLIEAECERMRDEFRVEFREALTAKQTRALLRHRQHALAQAARAVHGDDLQDADWLPHAGGYLGPEPDKNDAAAAEWRTEVPNLSSLGIARMLWALSEQAKLVADSLGSSDPRTSPTKEATVMYAYLLWMEFSPRRGRGQRSKVPRGAGGYDEQIVTNWSRHTPEFRAAYGRLRQARDRAPDHLTIRSKDESLPSVTIPVPKPAKPARTQPLVPPLKSGAPYVRPRRRSGLVKRPSRSNDFPAFASLLYQYFTGIPPEVKMEWSCRKVLGQLTS